MYFSLKPHLTEGAILLGLAVFLKEAEDMAEGKKGGWGAERREESSLFSCHCLLSASKSEEITRKVNHVAHSEKCLRS